MERLRFPEGEPVTFIPLEDKVASYAYHWVDNSSVSCLGSGCPLCAAGKKPKERYKLKVSRGNSTYELEMGRNLKTLLERELGEEKTFKGKVFTVVRKGTGLNTQYEVYRGGEAMKEEKKVSTSPQEVLSYLEEVLKDDRARAILSAFLYLVASFLEAVNKVENKSG